MANLSRKLQKWLKPLEHTPMHPQWLVLCHRDETHAWVAPHAQGALIDISYGNGNLRDDYQRWTLHGLRQLLERNQFKIREIDETMSAIETSSSLSVIAISKTMLDCITCRKPALLDMLPLLPLIPAINITGRLFGMLIPSSIFMPFSYRVIATRNSAHSGARES